jgi:hypothetical protein
MCAAEGFNDSYVGQVLPLAFLPPAVIESIPTCALLPYLTANRQISGGRLPATWSQQTLSETTVPSRQAPPSWRDAAADSSNQTREIRRNACGSINCRREDAAEVKEYLTRTTLSNSAHHSPAPRWLASRVNGIFADFEISGLP